MGATDTNEAEASTEIVDSNQDLPVVPAAATAREKSRNRSCEEKLLKPHKWKISEALRYYLNYSAQVEWGNTLQDKHGVYTLQTFAIECTNQVLVHMEKINGVFRCEKCEIFQQPPCTKRACNKTNNFLKTITEFLNEYRCCLCDQVQQLVQFYEELSAVNLALHDKNNNKNDNTIAYIDSPYSFIVSSMELYNTNLLSPR